LFKGNNFHEKLAAGLFGIDIFRERDGYRRAQVLGAAGI
jgi:hypothetical protein